MNSDWDFVQSGKRLWPFFIYWLGLADAETENDVEDVSTGEDMDMSTAFESGVDVTM